MLYPRVVEISTDEESGETYFLVKFWTTPGARGRDEKPHIVEEFIKNLRLEGTRPVDIDNPGLGREQYNRNLRAEIRDTVRRYIVEAEALGYAGDNTASNATTGDSWLVGGKVIRRAGVPVGKLRRRDMSDPHGILAKPEVAGLRGRNMDF